MKDSDHNSTTGIFDSLLQLPLIKGVSRVRLQEIAGRMKLHFVKVRKGGEIAAPGQQCVDLKFLLSGSVRLILTDGDGDFEVAQTLSAPQVIAPDSLFGLNTTYPCRVEALTDTGIMEISKEDYRRMLAMDPVFLFNYLNTTCSSSQRSQRGLLSIVAGSAAERLAYWVITLTQPGSTDISLSSSSRDLHTLLGISASAMRSATDKMAAAGIIDHVSARALHVSSRSALAAILDLG